MNNSIFLPTSGKSIYYIRNNEKTLVETQTRNNVNYDFLPIKNLNACGQNFKKNHFVYLNLKLFQATSVIINDLLSTAVSLHVKFYFTPIHVPKNISVFLCVKDRNGSHRAGGRSPGFPAVPQKPRRSGHSSRDHEWTSDYGRHIIPTTYLRDWHAAQK